MRPPWYNRQKKFTKKILYLWQKRTFYGFPLISVHYDRLQKIIPYFSRVWKSESWWPYFSHVWKSVSWWQFVQFVIKTRASKIISYSWLKTRALKIISYSWFQLRCLQLSMVYQQKENFKSNKFVYSSTSPSRVHK